MLWRSTCTWVSSGQHPLPRLTGLYDTSTWGGPDRESLNCSKNFPMGPLEHFKLCVRKTQDFSSIWRYSRKAVIGWRHPNLVPEWLRARRCPKESIGKLLGCSTISDPVTYKKLSFLISIAALPQSPTLLPFFKILHPRAAGKSV